MSYNRGDVLFYGTSSLIPALDWMTNLVTWSPWVHCAISLGNGLAVQSIAGGGVCTRGDFIQTKTAVVTYPGDVDFVLSELAKRMGDHYDYLGLLSVPCYDLTRLCWSQPKDHWFCSTLLAEPMRRDPTLAAKGISIAPKRPLHAIAPSHLYDALGGK